MKIKSPSIHAEYPKNQYSALYFTDLVDNVDSEVKMFADNISFFSEGKKGIGITSYLSRYVSRGFVTKFTNCILDLIWTMGT